MYLQNRVVVISQGNRGTVDNMIQYPAAYGQGILSVGATRNDDVRANYSTIGPWIDVSAPGGGGFVPSGQSDELSDLWYTTTPGSSYGFTYGAGTQIRGTSFAAPVVSGLAALLLAVNPSLENDDVKQIIRLSAVDVNVATLPGFDPQLGMGRVNARKALDLARAPYTFRRSTAIGGGTDQGGGTSFRMYIYGASGVTDGEYLVRRHEVRRNVSYPATANVSVWGRRNGSLGWSQESPNVSIPFTEVVPGTVTSTSATLRTYVYELFNAYGQFLGWRPTSPQYADFAYTVHGTPPPLAASISGPSPVPNGQSRTWTANPSGGTPGYAYGWRWRYTGCPPPPPPPCAPNTCLVGGTDDQPAARGEVSSDEPLGPDCAWRSGGTASTLTRSFTYAHQGIVALELTVTDAVAASVVATRSIQVTSGAALVAGADTEGASAQAEAAPGVATALVGVRPNPSRGAATVAFSLAAPMAVRVSVYDALGREVARLVEGEREAGAHEARLDGSALVPGVYVVRMTAGAYVATRRVTLMR